MNRYELGKRVPDLELIERVAAELNLPAAYFYADADDEAELLERFFRLSKESRMRFMKEIRAITL